MWLLAWPVGVCFVVFGELGFWLHGYVPRETFPLDLGVSSVSIAVGLVLWRLRPENRTGPLLYLAGVLWTIGGIRAYGNRFAFGVGQWFDGSQDLVLAHLLIAYPAGRLRTRPLRALVLAGYSLFLVHLLATLTWAVPFNGWGIWDSPSLHDTLDTVGSIGGGMYAVIGIGILSRRWWAASSTARRVIAPVLWTALVFAVTVAADSIVPAVTGSEPDLVFYPPLAARLLIPFAFLFGLMRARIEQAAVGDLVVELGAGGVETLRDALARTLHDGSLQLGYRVAGSNEYLDAAGAAVHLPRPGDPSAVTTIERDGEPLAVIIHDRALLEHQHLMESVAAAARLALDNERLYAQLRSQVDALRASRTRLVRAGDDERRRLERDLHDGAQQRLLGLGFALQLLRSHVGHDVNIDPLLAEAENELRLALHELRELARGIHPAILTDHGLASAARALAARAAIPVTVTAVEDRFPAPVETAGYFVVAEALTNIAKYSCATRAWVTIGRQNGLATIEVGDDGVGGADPAGGSGLAGLIDRLGALDGSLLIDSRPRHGTRIVAQIPCA